MLQGGVCIYSLLSLVRFRQDANANKSSCTSRAQYLLLKKTEYERQIRQKNRWEGRDEGRRPKYTSLLRCSPSSTLPTFSPSFLQPSFAAFFLLKMPLAVNLIKCEPVQWQSSRRKFHQLKSHSARDLHVRRCHENALE